MCQTSSCNDRWRSIEIIDDAQAGLTYPSERPELLAENIKKLSSLGQNELDKLGQNALNYYNDLKRLC